MDPLARIKEANFMLLKDIDQVCKRHNLRYFLDYGTLLGAVRHQDFIPWDDDVDIVVLREDYSNFIEVLKKELPEKYQVVEYTEHNGLFWDFISRIQIKDSYLHSPTENDLKYKNVNNRVSADIFILDKAPKSKIRFRFMVLELKVLYLLAMAHRHQLNLSDYSFLTKLLVGCFSIIGKMFSLKRIFNWHRKLCLSHKSKSRFCYVKSNALVCEMNFIFQQEWYADSTVLKLRNYDFPVPGNYEKVLQTIYGNYMEPPPLNEQKPLHCQDYYISEEFFNK